MPQTITDVHPRIGDLYQTLSPRMLAELPKNGRGYQNLSHLAEAEDPSDEAERKAGLDAFTRLLAHADIKVRSDRWGAYSADPVEKFTRSEADRALFHEFTRRTWWQAQEQRASRAPAVYMQQDWVLGTIARPYLDDAAPYNEGVVEPAIPLAEVVRGSRNITGRDFRARYLSSPTAEDVRMKRVAEGAELPKATITEGQRAVRLYKFGRSVEATYEALRYAPIDEFADYVRELSLQTEVDQVAAAVDVAVNGDGNSGTAATVVNLTTLDPGTTANNLTVSAWLSFKLLFQQPLALTAVLGTEAAIKKLLLLNLPSANLLATAAPVQSGINQTFVPMNNRLSDAVRYGVLASAAANTLIGFDGRFGVEHLRESGSEVNETERWITRQSEIMTFSFNEGFRVYNKNSTKILNLAA